ncbi:prolyl-tRNA synthetase associated domain-containing protein [Anaerofilum sp. BX8]|uniref:Prolyl-tRNA synthetase associated domain-containing protein n=1 Tax=Anaerofilum hominis TaxID=2763016 RepID=A0A923IAE1_9FIRM|nr:prolyl-tRNA synthetase associated domain-containing protein [Anaerofilum hominis]MBC5581786.1 prolyl-tRNA synthetase associated domain-containing protein [Anaerofilum hominis]
MEIFHGRPEDCRGREAREVRTYDLLDRLGVEYLRTDHAPATTMEVCKEIDRVLDVLICKNLFLCNRQQTRFYLLMMPGDKPFKTKDLSAQLGVARLSFGSEDFMEQFLGLHPGSVSVLGLMNDTDKQVRLVIDEEVLRDEYVGCHPCQNTSSIKLRTEDLLHKFLPAVGHEPTVVRL